MEAQERIPLCFDVAGGSSGGGAYTGPGSWGRPDADAELLAVRSTAQSTGQPTTKKKEVAEGGRQL